MKRGTIEISLCKRDSDGNKIEGRQRPIFVGVKPSERKGVVSTPERAAQMVNTGRVG